MQISLNLGSYTRKSTCHDKTPELCWICSPNHELNHQLLCRAINCNVTDGLCARCHHKIKKMQVDKKIIMSTGMDFFTFYATTGAEKCNHQLVVATTGAFTLTSDNGTTLSSSSVSTMLTKALCIILAGKSNR